MSSPSNDEKKEAEIIRECERIISTFDFQGKVHVVCRNWDGNPQTKHARGYFSADPLHIQDPQLPEIVLIPSRIRGGEKEIQEIIRHEMIHVYDHCVQRQDLRHCRALACSEIRAAREAECFSPSNRFVRLSCEHVPFTSSICERLKKSCVKKTAIKATRASFEHTEAATCVQEVFDTCYHNSSMFDDPIQKRRASSTPPL